MCSSSSGDDNNNIEGEIDLYASPQLREKFDEIAEGGVKAVVVNLDKVSYIDSSGLATFIEAYQKLRVGRES